MKWRKKIINGGVGRVEEERLQFNDYMKKGHRRINCRVLPNLTNNIITPHLNSLLQQFTHSSISSVSSISSI